MKRRLNYFRCVVIVLTMMALLGCTPKTVTVERVVEREKKITAEVHDTTVVYDSTGVRVMGDTVFVDRWHTKTRTVVKRDTIKTETRDSIPYRVAVEKERSLTDKACEWGKGAVVGGIIVGGGICFWWWRKRRRNKGKPPD